MSPTDSIEIPYYARDNNGKKRFLGYVTEAMAMAMEGVKVVRRKSSGKITQVIDRRDRLHRGEFSGQDVVSRPCSQRNHGKCVVTMLPNVGKWCYSLKGDGI